MAACGRKQPFAERESVALRGNEEDRSMDGSEYLNTIAEVAVAFVGFAAIAVAIRRSDKIVDFRGLIAALVERGLAALGFALLPTLFYHFGVPPATSLPVLSGLLSAYLLILFVRLYHRFFRSQITVDMSTRGAVARLTLTGVMIPVQALAAVGLLPFSPLGLYLLGVTWLLILAGGVFSTILRRAV